MEVCAIVLAAGEGRRMRSRRSKMVHRLSGRPLICWIREALNSVGALDQVYIVGYLQDQVRAVLGEDVAFVIQEQQLGTGHAVMQAAPFLESRPGCTIVLAGDAPLITPACLQAAIEQFQADGCAAVVVTADADDPTGYGRIIRSAQGDIEAIVEHRDASPEQLAIREINSGMYCFSTPLLLSALGRIGSRNALNEYYLTDTIAILIQDGHKVGALKTVFEDTVGVNDRVQLAQAARIMNRRICERHMRDGITILDPENTWIDDTVRIGMDTEILPGTRLEGETVVGEDCVIGPDTRLTDAVLGNGVVMPHVIAAGCHIGDNTRVGPFACIHPGAKIGRRCHIGTFVEINALTSLGDDTSATLPEAAPAHALPFSRERQSAVRNWVRGTMK
jgi:bifunctional UDP-N-acetylglucosamine pyrophosphorylase/glucosamine-1-phosphate N-acetyltransferase